MSRGNGAEMSVAKKFPATWPWCYRSKQVQYPSFRMPSFGQAALWSKGCKAPWTIESPRKWREMELSHPWRCFPPVCHMTCPWRVLCGNVPGDSSRVGLAFSFTNQQITSLFGWVRGISSRAWWWRGRMTDGNVRWTIVCFRAKGWQPNENSLETTWFDKLKIWDHLTECTGNRVPRTFPFGLLVLHSDLVPESIVP